jgi:type I restriction enzyme R subunit
LHDTTLLEADARKEIDGRLVAAGRVIPDKNKINLFEKLGVAVREFPLQSEKGDTGYGDYMLFIAGKACGIIECQARRRGFVYNNNCKNILSF